MTINSPPELMTETEVANMLRLKRQTLSVWRLNRRYALPWVKVGGRVFYNREDVLAFLDSRRVDPTATTAG